MNDQTSKLFPMFDGHMHFSQAYLDEALASYDECGVIGGINLWGSAYGIYDAYTYPFDYLEFLKLCNTKNLGNRFVQFCWPDWNRFGRHPNRFVEEFTREMRQYADLGCRGLKVWKDLGMFIRHKDGSPALMDDPRLEPIWRTAASLEWTISIHQADPSRGWETNTKTGISRQELFERRDRVIAAHPEIPFILCHSGNYIESVEKFGQMLERFPNVNADLSPLDAYDTPQAIAAFLERYADRLYLGIDLAMPSNRPPDRPWNLNELYGPMRQVWLKYGIADEALEKIAWRNGQEHFLNRRS